MNEYSLSLTHTHIHTHTHTHVAAVRHAAVLRNPLFELGFPVLQGVDWAEDEHAAELYIARSYLRRYGVKECNHLERFAEAHVMREHTPRTSVAVLKR